MRRRPVSKAFVILSLLVGILLLFSLGYAEDYYVKNGGNDDLDGLSDANAWATIAKVNATAFNASDNIYFNKGDIWREQLTVPSSGSSGSPITFGAYGTGAKPIISAADIEASWTQEGSLYYATGYIADPNIVIRNGNVLEKEVNKVDVDASTDWWYDAANDRVYIYGDPSGDTVEIGTRSYAITCGATDYITVDGIELQGATNSGFYVAEGGTYNTLQNSTAKFNYRGLSMHPTTDHITITTNTVTYNMIESYINGTNNQTDHNVFSYNAVRICANGTGSGLYAGSGATGAIIEHNEFHHNGLGCPGTGTDHGLYVGSGAYTIRYNYTHHNKAAGIILNDGNGTKVYYNISHDNNYGIGVSSVETGVDIYNNVVYSNHDTGGVGSGGIGINIPNSTVDNLKNNIIFGNHHLTDYARQIWLGATGVLTASDYNIIYGSGSGNVCEIDSTDYTFAEWQGAGYDANSQEVDPLMTDPANDDFTLLMASPCIDKGTDVGLTEDYAGNSVPQGSAPDIGAYEYPGGIIPLIIPGIIPTIIPVIKIGL